MYRWLAEGCSYRGIKKLADVCQPKIPPGNRWPPDGLYETRRWMQSRLTGCRVRPHFCGNFSRVANGLNCGSPTIAPAVSRRRIKLPDRAKSIIGKLSKGQSHEARRDLPRQQSSITIEAGDGRLSRSVGLGRSRAAGGAKRKGLEGERGLTLDADPARNPCSSNAKKRES